MSTIKNKSRKAAGVVVGSMLLTGSLGVAYGFWTQGGAGTGSADTGTISALVVKQTSVVTGIAPGLAPQTLSGNFDNPNTSPVYVGTVTAAIAGVTQAPGAVGTCDASDYTLANAAMAVNAQVPAGSAKGAWTGATLAFNNKSGVNQDGCKGATVQLTYTVS